jgi:hypothetical protein
MNLEITEFEDDYLVISFGHTFLASSLKEEAYLYSVSNPMPLVARVVELFRTIKPDYCSEQSLDMLSGGENALLAVIFYSSLVEYKHKSVQLLLHNIMESLSAANRRKLIKLTRQFTPHNIRYYNLENGKPTELHE